MYRKKLQLEKTSSLSPSILSSIRSERGKLVSLRTPARCHRRAAAIGAWLERAAADGGWLLMLGPSAPGCRLDKTMRFAYTCTYVLNTGDRDALRVSWSIISTGPSWFTAQR